MKIRLSAPQAKSLQCRQQLLLAMAGQRAGKTYMMGLRSANYVRYFPKMVGMIAANTYKQLTQSTMVEVRRVWKKDFGISMYDKKGNPDGVYVIGRRPPAHFTVYHEFDDYAGIVSFRNGAVIFTASLENYLAHEGKTLGWAELDETKDTKEAAVKQVILARLSQKGLFYSTATGDIIYSEGQVSGEYTPYNPCVINSSPAEGTVDWLEDMFDLKGREEEILEAILPETSYYYREFSSKAVLIYSTYWNTSNLPANYIQKRKDQLSEGEVLKFIFGYPFSKTGGEYYPHFDRLQHVHEVTRDPQLPDHLTYDFNLWPYMTLVCCQIVETAEELNFNFYKEYCFKPPLNTSEAVTLAFIDDHAPYIYDVNYYGDAMGTRGIEGFGNDVTRFDDIRTALFKYITDDNDRTMRYNYGVNKRRNLVNKILEGKLRYGKKKVNIIISPECRELIRDMQYLKQGVNGKYKEKVKDEATGVTYEKLGHTSDAVEYLIAQVLEDYL